MRKITIKEVKKWVNSFPINDWSKKPTQLEMRRITYFCNHGTNSRLPENISSKNDLIYSREKSLAEKYLKDDDIIFIHSCDSLIKFERSYLYRKLKKYDSIILFGAGQIAKELITKTNFL